jgi:anti-sigma B factor antagonist
MSDEMFGIAIHDGVCTVRCHGQLIGERATRLRDEVKPLVGKGKTVRLDLTEVTFMDSLGLGVLAALYISARTAGGQLEVINLTPRLRDLLSVSHLLSLFEPVGQSNVKML